MKLRNIIVLVFTLLVAFAFVNAQTKDVETKKTSDKKSDCPMHASKPDTADLKKCEQPKECCKKDGKVPKNCCSKEGKMSDNCSYTDKAKCDKSKAEMKDCPKSKSKTSDTKSTESKNEKK